MNIDPILLESFASRFINRTNAYGRQYLNEDSKCVYTAVYCRYGFENVIRAHVASTLTIGVPALDERGYCKWCCFDGDDNSGKIDKIEKLLIEHGWHCVREGMRQGRDGHLWIFFSQPILAADLRLFMRHIVKSAGIESMDNLDLFPSMDMPNWDDKRRLFLASSFVRLPLCFHLKVNQKLWFRDAPEDIEAQLRYVQGLPYNPVAPVQKLAGQLRQIETARQAINRRKTPMRTGSSSKHDIESLLRHIPPDLPYPQWFRAGAAIFNTTGDFQTFDSWSAGGTKYKPKACVELWDSLHRNPGGKRCGYSTLKRLAGMSLVGSRFYVSGNQ